MQSVNLIADARYSDDQPGVLHAVKTDQLLVDGVYLKAGQKTGYGQRYFSVDFGVTDHAAVAGAFGIRSWRVTKPSELGPALKAALSSAEPTLVDIVCQPLHEAKAPVSEWVA